MSLWILQKERTGFGLFDRPIGREGEREKARVVCFPRGRHVSILKANCMNNRVHACGMEMRGGYIG